MTAAAGAPWTLALVSRTLPNGMTVGVERPVLLLALLAVVAVGWLVFRSEGMAGTWSRRLLFASRVLIVVSLVVAAAGPYVVETKTTPGDPRVTVLVDRSESMSVSPDVAPAVVDRIEAQGVPATVATIGSETRSAVGEGVAANLRENGSVVLISDGRVTDGRSLTEVAEVARSLNATVSRVAVEPDETERYVTLHGPAKTSPSIENTFLVRVRGVNAQEPVTVRVDVDGETVQTETLQNGTGDVEFAHTFDSVGYHRVTATIDGDDRFVVNDEYHRSVHVVKQPRILYVSQGTYPFQTYLEGLYDVETANRVPSDLSEYYAVVIQDTPASEVGNVDALQRFVIDGGGLLVVGGNNAYDLGGYQESSLASMLPVDIGEDPGRKANLVLLVDVSGSAQEGMEVQKALALDVLSQLGDENDVGIVGFNFQAYRVANLQPLGGNRKDLQDKIKRLSSGGATDIASGLRGAGEMLGEEQGTIILISDGGDRVDRPAAVAGSLRREGIQVIAVGAGRNVQEDTLRTIAQESGGTFLRAGDTDRLRILFGGSSRQYEGQGLTIVNSDSFITSGVTLESDPREANDVSVRRGAEYLVASGTGKPAVASWRYGLGRVVSITAYGSDGTLDGLLSQPDSLLLTKSANYVIGDPSRKSTGVTDISDTRVGEPATITYRGDARPQAEGIDFRRVSEDTYRGTVTPERQGFDTVLSARYAANYRAEYEGFGPSPQLSALVETTDGRTFAPGQGAAIAEFAREQATRVRSVRTDLTLAFVLFALILFAAEVIARRVQVYQGKTRNEGGLP